VKDFLPQKLAKGHLRLCEIVHPVSSSKNANIAIDFGLLDLPEKFFNMR
jgi:hypothetical protein